MVELPFGSSEHVPAKYDVAGFYTFFQRRDDEV